jgi:class 3 adenylate cyclase
VQIRIGINSGEVIVRAVGSDLRWDYTAVGMPTHVAARMEQLATPGSTVITADTLAHVEPLIDVRPLGRVAVKGLAEGVEAYEVLGVRPAGFPASGPGVAARPTAPFPALSSRI